jgi:mxaJ protein
VVLSVALFVAISSGAWARDLRVCADQDNLPYSSRSEPGFENRIASLVATELKADLSYVWVSPLRGYVNKTLGARMCDVLVGWPREAEDVLTTRPYYISEYLFVYRVDHVGEIASFDDPRLRELTVGVPVVGDDLAATPPGHALAKRGIVDNVVGFTPFGVESSQARILAMLKSGAIDVAVLWGPQASWVAQHLGPGYATHEARDDAHDGAISVFPIAVAVRLGETALRDEIDQALERARPAIELVLDGYGVPRVRGKR